MKVEIIDGNILDQNVSVIVNSWNRNIIPWWLLLPQGVSGAIKKKAGVAPFRELGKKGAIPLGGAVETSSGKLNYESIIHVAGINMFWTATINSIQDSVRNSMKIVNEKKYDSISYPIIGAGSGRFNEDEALGLMVDMFSNIDSSSAVSIIRFNG